MTSRQDLLASCAARDAYRAALCAVDILAASFDGGGLLQKGAATAQHEARLLLADALCESIESGAKAVSQALLRLGADADVSDSSGRAPRDVAKAFGRSHWLQAENSYSLRDRAGISFTASDGSEIACDSSPSHATVSSVSTPGALARGDNPVGPTIANIAMRPSAHVLPLGFLRAGNPPSREGWLRKRGRKLPRWRKRYFMLYPGRLEYYLQDPYKVDLDRICVSEAQHRRQQRIQSQPRGFVKLLPGTRIELQSGQPLDQLVALCRSSFNHSMSAQLLSSACAQRQVNCRTARTLVLHLPTRKMYCECVSVDDALEWVIAIQNAILPGSSKDIERSSSSNTGDVAAHTAIPEWGSKNSHRRPASLNTSSATDDSIDTCRVNGHSNFGDTIMRGSVSEMGTPIHQSNDVTSSPSGDHQPTVSPGHIQRIRRASFGGPFTHMDRSLSIRSRISFSKRVSFCEAMTATFEHDEPAERFTKVHSESLMVDDDISDTVDSDSEQNERRRIQQDDPNPTSERKDQNVLETECNSNPDKSNLETGTLGNNVSPTSHERPATPAKQTSIDNTASPGSRPARVVPPSPLALASSADAPSTVPPSPLSLAKSSIPFQTVLLKAEDARAQEAQSTQSNVHHLTPVTEVTETETLGTRSLSRPSEFGTSWDTSGQRVISDESASVTTPHDTGVHELSDDENIIGRQGSIVGRIQRRLSQWSIGSLELAEDMVDVGANDEGINLQQSMQRWIEQARQFFAETTRSLWSDQKHISTPATHCIPSSIDIITMGNKSKSSQFSDSLGGMPSSSLYVMRHGDDACAPVAARLLGFHMLSVNESCYFGKLLKENQIGIQEAQIEALLQSLDQVCNADASSHDASELKSHIDLAQKCANEVVERVFKEVDIRQLHRPLYASKQEISCPAKVERFSHDSTSSHGPSDVDNQDRGNIAGTRPNFHDNIAHNTSQTTAKAEQDLVRGLAYTTLPNLKHVLGAALAQEKQTTTDSNDNVENTTDVHSLHEVIIRMNASEMPSSLEANSPPEYRLRLLNESYMSVLRIANAISYMIWPLVEQDCGVSFNQIQSTITGDDTDLTPHCIWSRVYGTCLLLDMFETVCDHHVKHHARNLRRNSSDFVTCMRARNLVALLESYLYIRKYILDLIQKLHAQSKERITRSDVQVSEQPCTHEENSHVGDSSVCKSTISTTQEANKTCTNSTTTSAASTCPGTVNSTGTAMSASNNEPGTVAAKQYRAQTAYMTENIENEIVSPTISTGLVECDNMRFVQEYNNTMPLHGHDYIANKLSTLYKRDIEKTAFSFLHRAYTEIHVLSELRTTGPDVFKQTQQVLVEAWDAQSPTLVVKSCQVAVEALVSICRRFAERCRDSTVSPDTVAHVANDFGSVIGICQLLGTRIPCAITGRSTLPVSVCADTRRRCAHDCTSTENHIPTSSVHQLSEAAMTEAETCVHLEQLIQEFRGTVQTACDEVLHIGLRVTGLIASKLVNAFDVGSPLTPTLMMQNSEVWSTGAPLNHKVDISNLAPIGKGFAELNKRWSSSLSIVASRRASSRNTLISASRNGSFSDRGSFGEGGSMSSAQLQRIRRLGVMNRLFSYHWDEEVAVNNKELTENEGVVAEVCRHVRTQLRRARLALDPWFGKAQISRCAAELAAAYLARLFDVFRAKSHWKRFKSTKERRSHIESDMQLIMANFAPTMSQRVASAVMFPLGIVSRLITRPASNLVPVVACALILCPRGAPEWHAIIRAIAKWRKDLSRRVCRELISQTESLIQEYVHDDSLTYVAGSDLCMHILRQATTRSITTLAFLPPGRARRSHKATDDSTGLFAQVTDQSG